MIVGTAGHIDHGKTALVRALTGVDTDRLKEEKARGITIDLGFAYLPTPTGDTLGFIDVPGHEKFVHNMLAGATGIDFMLLVVAADDGPMPQTVEHLAIIDLLGVERGIVALTKADLADQARRDDVEAAIRQLLEPTCLAEADIVPVSVVTGEGIDALRDRLFVAADQFGRAADDRRFRLAIDRSFTLAGAGTVVTGTVLSGSVSFEWGAESASSLIGLADVTAAFCTADLVAAGLQAGLLKRGKRIPQDYAVMGFDNLSMSRMIYPALTTVDQGILAKGRLAGNLITAILGKEDVPRRTTTGVSIVARDSVGWRS